MYRVRFNEQHTDGYRPAQDVARVAARVFALLKRQRMVLSHTDEAGFACYVPAATMPKRRRQAKPCPRCGYTAMSARQDAPQSTISTGLIG